ncbi:hypothetical protein RRG08_036379 [Elysia crispata]|uniref:Uncharacterized protein n=1 Tax=Elysia crispata TaxID=231223 RepID=A0AAE1DHJ7_9GAST|nr:hypothetical protein RRG08_036379 [Elysia crispata]
MFLVTSRQLVEFLEGGAYGEKLSSSQFRQLENCPLTTLIGERAFGDLDFDMGHRRQCSLFNRAAKHMLKRNRTMDWLSNKSGAEQERILAEGRKVGQKLRKKYKKQEDIVRLKIKEKLVENERKKHEKELKDAKDKQEIIDKIMKEGGVCNNRKHVDKIDTAESLKLQLRYQKECREAEEKVINATREKFLENQQKKIEKEINDIDRRSNISEAVLKHGGPCLRQEDVDELEERKYLRIGFGSIKTDTCSFCESHKYQIKNEQGLTAKARLMAELKVQKRRANLFYELINEKRPGLKTFSFVHQQNLVLPRVADQQVYYSRQFYVYNFALVEIAPDGKLTPENVTSYTCTGDAFRKDSSVCASAVFNALKGDAVVDLQDQHEGYQDMKSLP